MIYGNVENPAARCTADRAAQAAMPRYGGPAVRLVQLCFSNGIAAARDGFSRSLTSGIIRLRGRNDEYARLLKV